MPTATITVTPHPTMGAEVVDVDLAHLDDDTFKAVLDAWHRYAVLVFPGQRLTEDAQIAFTKRLGRLERLVTKKSAANLGNQAKIGKLANLDKEGNPVPEGSSLWLFLKGNQYWHSDSSFKTVSAKASMLSAWAVPSEGGETEWADMRQAYDALDQATKDRLEGLVAVHSYWYSQSLVGGTDVLSEEDWAALPPVEHPVIRTNEDSGRTSLFIGRHASHVKGMDEGEGRALLEELYEYATQPQWVHRHRWQPGDAVLWDNRSVLHRGRPWPPGDRRVMKRTTVAGEGDNDWMLGEF
ncbi:MAG: TauD/TfdA family dioxygenase [Acidimicrobiia bacterium]|nr:TauD/TfdA family dioxygenase [Acidimicrobiia bacterium]